MPVEKTELLRQAGYSDGEFIPVVSVSALGSNFESTTSTSFTNFNQVLDLNPIWDILFPDDGQIQAVLGVAINPGSGETAEYRIRNTTDNETIAETGPVTSQSDQFIGPVDYTPSTTDQIIDIRVQAKTDPGSNSSNYTKFFHAFGVEP